jgi:hypothetical protein
MTDKTASQTISPRGAAYCDTPGTSCFYNDSDDCINCGRHKGWRRAAKSPASDKHKFGLMADLAKLSPQDLIDVLHGAMANREDAAWHPKPGPERDDYCIPAPDTLAGGWTVTITPDKA